MRSCDLSAVSMASLMQHLSTEYLAGSVVSEWRSEGVSEWVGETKRRIYVLSVELYIFCMTDNGQVPTHTLKGKTVEADTSVTSFLSPERVCGYTRQRSLLVHRHLTSWWASIKRGVHIDTQTHTGVSLDCTYAVCPWRHHCSRLMDMTSNV